jgi:signal transduction histidine kinase
MTSPSPKKTRVLYVENDPGIRRLVQKNLEREGFHIDTADRGIEGLGMHKANSYDVILVDQNMPSMKGTEFIQLLSPKRKLVPVIMVTGSGDESVAVEAMKRGASDYIIKDIAGGFIKLLPSVITRVIKENNFAKERAELLIELDRSNKELENFAHIASHDLQEPLRKINTYVKRLPDLIPELELKAKDCLHIIADATERMQDFIERVLQYSKVTKKERSFQDVYLGDIAHSALVDLEVLVTKTNGVVNIKELPTLQADPLQMYQLFQNLISNALKYHRPGIPPVINLSSSKIEDGYWALNVTDNGIGFDSKFSDKIFKLFERLHSQNEYSGTGIGLAICEKIAKLHKGEITVKTQINAGTTFIITLPEKQVNTCPSVADDHAE